MTMYVLYTQDMDAEVRILGVSESLEKLEDGASAEYDTWECAPPWPGFVQNSPPQSPRLSLYTEAGDVDWYIDEVEHVT